MQDFREKVAVITGAASGIGLAIASSLVGAGAKVVLADVEREKLSGALADLECPKEFKTAFSADVTDPKSVCDLRDFAVDTFAKVDLIFNNAGVSTINKIEDTSVEDWRWVIDVNLMGVVHGINSFLPLFQSQGSEARIVNTASPAGLISGMPFQSTYGATKAAVISLSETLREELAEEYPHIGVTLALPGVVATNIMESDRNRPMGKENRRGVAADYFETVSGAMEGAEAMDSDTFAKGLLGTIQKGDFIYATHGEFFRPFVQSRFERVLREAYG